MKTVFQLDMLPQPDDTTCGPTCLHAVYRYFDDPLPLRQVIEEVHVLEGGGTLEVLLACHALRRGYRATIYTYNLQIFDPTWFAPGAKVDLAAKLKAQMAVKEKPKLAVATEAYLEYLRLGGEIRFQDLSGRLLRKYLKQETPILCGLSATYLYHCAREHHPDPNQPTMQYNDVKGTPTGHFVVLCGYDMETRQVLVADPAHQNPLGGDKQHYSVSIDRLLGAIMLGIMTYDGNLLILKKGQKW